ncbi:hypothetical protein [Leptolyngbya phage Lbo-JY46]
MTTHLDNLKDYIDVDAQKFYEFIGKHELTPVQGALFHSNFYIDKIGNYLAYRETSSWNTKIKYKIKI